LFYRYNECDQKSFSAIEKKKSLKLVEMMCQI